MYPISFACAKRNGDTPKEKRFLLVRWNLILAETLCVVIPEQDTLLCIADRSLSRLRGSPLPGAGCWGHLTCVWLVHPARCVRLGSLSHGGTCPLPATAPGRSNVPTRDDCQAPGPIPSGTANPNAHRRHSRRSRNRLDKRTYARHSLSAQHKPKRHSQPKCAPAAKPPQPQPAGQTQLCKTKGLNGCTRQDNSAHVRNRT